MQQDDKNFKYYEANDFYRVTEEMIGETNNYEILCIDNNNKLTIEDVVEILETAPRIRMTEITHTHSTDYEDEISVQIHISDKLAKSMAKAINDYLLSVVP